MNANGIPAKPSQASAARLANPKSQTLYVRNLNEKVSKSDLRRALYTLFSSYGHILDIVALKTTKMRGQAHIVFRDSESSSQAMQTLQGFEFLGKELDIHYGKGRSDIISKLDGSARAPEASKTQPPQANNGTANHSILPPPTALPKIPTVTTTNLKAPNGLNQDGSKSPQGTKRPRDADSDDGEPMEDEDDAMDVSDED